MEPSNILQVTTLSDGWCDKDVVMLHACFQLLTDCIEKENLLTGNTDWNADEEHKKARKDIEELYQWWLDRKGKSNSEKFNDLDRTQYNENNEKLIKLIKVRQYLWT
jgi:hypothetical protein